MSTHLERASFSICMLATNDMLNDPRVTRHAETLGKRGYDVTIVCPISNRTTRIEHRTNYTIIRVQNRLLQYMSALAKQRRQNYSSMSSVERPPFFASKKGLAWLRRLALRAGHIILMQMGLLRAARRVRAHVYCANDLDTLLIAILAAGNDRKIVYDSHELWTDMLISVPASVKTMLQNFERFLIRKADAVMTVNELIAEVLANRYSIAMPAWVYNCPSHNAPSKAPKGKKRSTKIALYQGRYAPERGLENLVKASRYLRDDVELVFRGYGNIEGELRALGSGMKNLRFEPPVPMEDLVDEAQSADVGIVSYLPTNLCNYLASPNKLFEYILAGLPVAASDMPFMRTVVRGYGIGVLFDPSSPESIARALNRITRTRELQRCKRNLISVAEKFSWDTESRKLVQLYAQFERVFRL